MLKDAEYIRMPEGSAIVEGFLNAIVSLRNDEVEAMLENFCRGEGYALNDDVYCCFAAEVPERDPEHFSDSGVAVYRYSPAEDKQTVVLMEENMFIAMTTKVILDREEDFDPDRFAEVKKLLLELWG